MDKIIFTYKCDNCGEEIEIIFQNSTNNKIPLLFLSGLDFICNNCGLHHYSVDFEILNENEL